MAAAWGAVLIRGKALSTPPSQPPPPQVIKGCSVQVGVSPFALVGKKNMYVGDSSQILPFHVVTLE